MRRRDLFDKFVLFCFPNLRLVKFSVNRLKTIFDCYNSCFNKNKTDHSKNMVSPLKIGLGSLAAFLFIIIFGWVAFPRLINSQIKTMTALKAGNDNRELFLKVPFPLVFKVYIFNITNPNEVTEKGATPQVQEIGPYVYDEWKEKVEIVENEKHDTMLYTIKNTFIFNNELSTLTGNEIVTIPHPLIAGLAMALEIDKPSALGLANKAVNSIFSNPTTPFLTATVNELLFSGILINCNITDFAGKAVCSGLKTEAKLPEVEPGILKFSFFGAKNGTLAQKVKVKRGIQNYRDLGRVVEFEGQKELTIWGGKECNTFQGTDSTIFPPFLAPEEGIVSFSPDICRSLNAYYVEESKYAGIPVRRYSADFGDQSTIKEDKCYCPTPDTCLKKGVMDLKKCVGAPFLASLPHFYLSDPSYINSVKGLTPNKEDHEIVIYFESMTGSPVSAKKRMQFSLPVHAIPKITTMKDFPDATIPIFWVEEGVDLNSTWTSQLNNKLFRVLKIAKIMKYIILVASIGGMAAAGFLFYSRREAVTITPVRNVEESDEKRKNVISMLAQNGHSPIDQEGHINKAMANNEIDKY